MNRKYVVIVIALFVMLLSSCSSSNNKNEAEAVFIGSIVNIEGEIATVAIEEGDILKSGGEVIVDLSVADETNLKVLDRVKVGHDGEVRESLPLGINTKFVELMK